MQGTAFTTGAPPRAASQMLLPRQQALLSGVRAQNMPVMAAAATLASRPDAQAAKASSADPLMLRVLRGEAVERTPVWMMRQAGRYMKVYQDLVKKHPSFRERSEKVELAVEISLQPWRAFRPDGVILFSDILTPLAGMNIPFDIAGGQGPVIFDPIRTKEQVEKVTRLNAEESCPFVGEALRQLRAEVGNQSTVLGFVGAPFTLATYIIEGGSSKNFAHTKRMAFTQPEVLHSLLTRLADNVADYVRYQADCGAQAVQIFDSWASELAPQDFDVFAGPYIRRIIADVKRTHPHLPIILYISGGGGLLERMAACGPDIVSLDQSVDLIEGIKRVGSSFAIQGNMDPGVLFGSKEFVQQRVQETMRKANSQGVRHIMNLGHGVLPGTPEESVAHFFEAAKNFQQ